MALFGHLPYIAIVYRQVFVIFPSQVADAYAEIHVQPPGNGQRVAIFHASGKVGTVEERAARFAAHVAAPAGFEVVGQHLRVDAEVVSRERFLLGGLAQPPAHRDVAPVGTPIPVYAVFLRRRGSSRFSDKIPPRCSEPARHHIANWSSPPYRKASWMALPPGAPGSAPPWASGVPASRLKLLPARVSVVSAPGPPFHKTAAWMNNAFPGRSGAACSGRARRPPMPSAALCAVPPFSPCCRAPIRAHGAECPIPLSYAACQSLPPVGAVPPSCSTRLAKGLSVPAR